MASEPIQILLVGSSTADARRVTQMLRAGSTKFRLRRAQKLRHAKRHLRDGRPDVAILDLSLPEAEGLEVLAEALRTAPSVPLVALGVAADDSLAALALQLGAQDFLVKSELNGGQLARSLRYAIARQQAQSSFRSLSLMDELTALHNRRGFLSLAEQRLKLTWRQSVRSTLVFIDGDNLKYINDNFGHREGDYALQQIAGLLRECFRESDVIARVGGDEFCVLLSDTADASDSQVRKRLFELIDKNNVRSKRCYALSVSLGVVEVGGPYELERQIGRADALMYEHKRAKQVSIQRLTRFRELV